MKAHTDFFGKFLINFKSSFGVQELQKQNMSLVVTDTALNSTFPSRFNLWQNQTKTKI